MSFAKRITRYLLWRLCRLFASHGVDVCHLFAPLCMTCSIRETWRGWRNTCHDPGELLTPSDSRFERELPGIWWQSASVNTSQVVNKSIDFTRPAWWIGSWFKVVFPLFELFWMLVLNWKCFPINCFDSVENYKISTFTLLLVYILFFFPMYITD